MRGVTVTFPAVYSGLERAELLDAFAAGPERVRVVLRGLDARDLGARPRPGKWSILEIVAHLADSDLIGAARIRLVLAQPGSPLTGYDQDAWARTFAHQELGRAGLQGTLRLFTALRQMTLRLLRSASEYDWQETGLHPDYGAVTLRNLLELYADHGERHLAQMLTIRELIGKPLSFPLLFGERLY